MTTAVGQTTPNSDVAPSWFTELGAKVKQGKTTLMLSLVSAVLDGNLFLGQPTRKTAVVYLTEQPRTSFTAEKSSENGGDLGVQTLTLAIGHGWAPFCSRRWLN
jgi:hypothetical protein